MHTTAPRSGILGGTLLVILLVALSVALCISLGACATSDKDHVDLRAPAERSTGTIGEAGRSGGEQVGSPSGHRGAARNEWRHEMLGTPPYGARRQRTG